MIIVRNQLPTLIPPGGRCQLGFVGEAPAEKEITAGSVFAGSSGYELSKWFTATNIVRPTVFIGNLSQERAPGDKLERMYVDSACQKPSERLQRWINVLKEDLENIRPNCVVALGNHAMYALTGKGTGKGGIQKYWGSILPCILVPGIKVVPIPHPSWLIRGNFAMRPILLRFLRRAIDESKYPEMRLPEREYILDPPFEIALHHIHRLMSSGAIAFDIERPKVPPGKRTFITHISFSDSPYWAMSIPFVRGKHLRWHTNQHAELLRAIAALFSTDALKIGHNLMFDFLNTTNEWGIYIRPPYYDTMVAHNRCYPDLTDKRLKKMRLNSLSFCTALYTREPFYKDDYKSENEDNPTWRGSENEFQLYNAKDSVVAYEIMERTQHDLKTFGVYDIFLKDMQVFEPLAFMGLKGVRRNQELLEKVTTEATDIIEDVQKKIDEVVGKPFNLNSPPQMQRVLYHERGHKVQINRKSGNPTTDEAALRRLERLTHDPLIPLILKYRRFDKFFDYLETIIPPDGRTRCTYNQARTTTFRISSSASSIDGSGGNLQNIPSYPRPGEEDYNKLIKLLKQTYIPDPDQEMGRRDYKQGEAIVVAYLAEDDFFINAFHSGEDMHCHSFTWISGEDYAKVRDEYLNGNPEYKVKRNLGKKSAHAFNYKMGKRRFRDELSKAGFDFEERQCGIILQALESARPAVVRWWQEVEEKVRKTRIMTNCFGRRRFFMTTPVNEDVIREAIAFEPQSTVGDLLNFSLWEIWNDMQEEIDLLLQIHDAVMWQSSPDLMDSYAERIGKHMAIPLVIKGRKFTIPTDFSKGPSWGELKEIK